MNTFWGCEPEALTDLSTVFADGGDRIRLLRERILETMHATTWEGPDAQVHRQRTADAAATMTHLLEALRRFSEQLCQEAEAQTVCSSAEGAPSHDPLGIWATPPWVRDPVPLPIPAPSRAPPRCRTPVSSTSTPPCSRRPSSRAGSRSARSRWSAPRRWRWGSMPSTTASSTAGSRISNRPDWVSSPRPSRWPASRTRWRDRGRRGLRARSGHLGCGRLDRERRADP